MIGAGSQTSNIDRSDSLIYSDAVQMDTTNDIVRQADGTDIGTLMGSGSWTYIWWLRNPLGATWASQTNCHWAKGANTFSGSNFIRFQSGGDIIESQLTQFFHEGDTDPTQNREAPWWLLHSYSSGSTIQLKSFTLGALESPIRDSDVNNMNYGLPGSGVYSPPNVPTKTFVCFALTCDASGTNRDFKLYINGVEVPASTSDHITAGDGYTEVALASGTNFESHVGSATFNLQTQYNLLASSMNVQLGPQAFWDSVLTQAEIKEIFYNHPKLTFNSGDYTSAGDLQRWYKFDEGTGTSVADSSGNSGQAFDLVNGPTWVKENIVP